MQTRGLFSALLYFYIPCVTTARSYIPYQFIIKYGNHVPLHKYDRLVVYTYVRDLRLFRDVENVGELATTPGAWALPYYL